MPNLAHAEKSGAANASAIPAGGASGGVSDYTEPVGVMSPVSSLEVYPDSAEST